MEGEGDFCAAEVVRRHIEEGRGHPPAMKDLYDIVMYDRKKAAGGK